VPWIASPTRPSQREWVYAVELANWSRFLTSTGLHRVTGPGLGTYNKRVRTHYNPPGGVATRRMLLNSDVRGRLPVWQSATKYPT
jgi:hypothetical protein